MDLFSQATCQKEHQELVSTALIRAAGVMPEELYYEADAIVRVARMAGEAGGHDYVTLPFCHTVEARALGADIQPADDSAGPRPGRYVMTGPEQIGEIRLAQDAAAVQLLESIRCLHETGDRVVYQISGPITILSCLMDLSKVFKVWRKSPQVMEHCLNMLQHMLSDYLKEICEAGADCISYADPAGGRQILGPRYDGMLTEQFLIPFLKEVVQICGGRSLLMVCPLTAASLSGAEAIRPAHSGDGNLAAGCVKSMLHLEPLLSGRPRYTLI